ncbi:hypothetical protein Tco_1066539 [Tanacetum coccineum]|uniref:Reverse transcriptase domain-containing protein n=1 Tax=Tanacetum coccineum TaxID=301880 RepID=A0ABQ5HC32_9ASTR
MADNRTMAELLQAPTEGYEDAIVIPEINTNFELKHGLIKSCSKQAVFRHDKEDPHPTRGSHPLFQQDHLNEEIPDCRSRQ